MNGKLSVEVSDTSRLEAFSDGVFSVAITLLAFNLAVPKPSDLHAQHQTLTSALLQQWPMYLAYVLSFAMILIMWVNHHMIFKHIARADRRFLLLNGFLLIVVTAIPFATTLLSEYLLDADKQTAMMVYSGLFFLMALAFNLMWFYAIKDRRLLSDSTTSSEIQSISKQYRFGPLVYIVIFGLSFLSAEFSLALSILLAIYFAVPSNIAAGNSDMM